jgi:hypothetical protein
MKVLLKRLLRNYGFTCAAIHCYPEVRPPAGVPTVPVPGDG